MPDIAWNLNLWNEKYDWEKTSPHWCHSFPSNRAYWRSLLLPRIGQFLPADTVLEIAPGHGRWTEFLAEEARILHIVDLSPNCIEACRKRFALDNNIVYHVNDGFSLDFIPDNSLDFVFSFDSLVHVDADVIASYLRYLGKKLKPSGVAFIHHSNLLSVLEENGRQPNEFKGCRSAQVSGKLFSELCLSFGLKCMCQELITWNSEDFLDCLSLFGRIDGEWEQKSTVIENRDFVRQRLELLSIVENYVINKKN